MTTATPTQPDLVAHCPNPECNPGLPPRPLHGLKGVITWVECRRCRRRYDLVKDKDTLIWKPPMRRGRKPTIGGKSLGPVLLGPGLLAELDATAAAAGLKRAQLLRLIVPIGLREWKAGKRK